MNAPAAAPANPPPIIDLALLLGSNGSITRPPRAAANYTLLWGQTPRSQQYLDELSRKYCKESLLPLCQLATTTNNLIANAYGINVQFTNLPQNYTLWWQVKRGRNNAQGAPAGDFFVYGHPRGRYTSVVKFIVHLHSMINVIVPCPCDRC
jgi:hypothetical protein